MSAENQATWAALPRWLLSALLFALFIACPSLAYLLDGPSETDAARDTALAVMDAIAAEKSER